MAKAALVTGGAGGIGLAIVKQLLERGDNVIVFDCVDNPKLENVQYFKVDISSVSSIQEAFNNIQDVDILVNNAGIARDNLAVRLTESDWDSVLNVNLKGAFFCAQQVLKIMLRKRSGYIINISSIVGQHGNPGQANYAASKAGIISLTKTLAAEYGSKNILVNAIAPGFIETKMTQRISDTMKSEALKRIPLKRFGKTDDIAKLVQFLTSGSADYITGSVINVDGGMH